MAAAARRSLLLFRNFGDEGFGGEHQGRDRSRVGERGAYDLGRIEHAGLDQVFVLVAERVIAEVRVFRVEHLAQDNRALFAGIFGDHAQGFLDGALHDVDPDLLIAFEFQLIECGRATRQRHASARDNAFLDCRAGRVHGVFDTSFLLFHLGLGRRAHFDHRHAADQFRQPLLQLLAVVVAGGLFDLAANLFHAAFDLAMLAFAFDNGGVVLVDGYLLGLPEVAHLDVFELDAQVFGDGLAAGQNGDVLQHGLAAIAEARGLDGRDL